MKRGRKTFSVMLAQVCCAAFVAALAGAVAGCAASEDGAQHPNDGGSVDAGTGGSSAGTGGSSAGTGGSSVGSGGSSAGSGGSSVGSGGTGTGTDGGGSGGSIVSPPDANDAGGTGLGPFGITSCQPKFEQACKPPIVFANQDPADKGKVFTDAVPDVTKAEQEIACTACSIIYRDPSEIPSNKHPSQIKIVLDTHGGVAQAGGDQIQFDLNYIAGFKGKNPADVKQEMLGVLQHETVHLYQNYGNSGTGEGLADLVRARTGFYPKSRFRKGEGTWKDAYTASGNFYSWLTGPCSFHSTFYPQHDLDLPYKLNKALAGKSGDDAYAAVAALLQATFGKGPDELWTAYQNTAF